MLTTRGWWFLAAVAAVALLGVVGLGWYSATVPVLGITLLTWFLGEWAAFAARFRAAAGRVRVERVLVQGGRVVPAAWAGGAVTVRVTVTLTGGYRLPLVLLRDRPPADAPRIDGKPAVAADLHPWEPVTIEYTLKPTSAGVLRFEGVQFRTADLSGFFYRRVFLRNPVEFLVLPPLTDDEGQRQGTKRLNTLPPPGIHRLRRPGSGSELLDLREYRPGDPPKMIAWKPSARRDRLITKEYESDVPVRCVLFLDASNGVRLGPPGEATAARLATVAAGVAQAAAGSRDLVGLSVFDDRESDFTPPARTQPHLIRMLRKIADAAGRLPEHGLTDPARLVRHAYPVARELYPDLLEKDVNSRPMGMFWIPLLDARWGWLVPALMVGAGYLVTRAWWVNAAARVALRLRPDLPSQWLGWLLALLGFGVLLVLPSLLLMAFWFLYGVRGFFGKRAKHASERKQLTALFALQDGTGPGAVERLLNDDGFFAERANRFLLEHRVVPPVELYDSNGNYRFRGEAKVPVLAAALTRAVSRARDNELYVILADLAEVADDLGPFVAAARVARARHHQLLVLVPWPADVPPPDEPPTGLGKDGRMKLGAVVRAGLTARYHRGFAALRGEMAKAGVQVVRVEDGDPVQKVLDRLDRLRGARVRR